MEQDKLNINVNSQGSEIIIRKGEALPAMPPVKVDLLGNIDSVGNFLNVRLGDGKGSGSQIVDLTKALMIIDKKDLSITLLLDPENIYGTSVKGKLEFTTELLQFAINSNQTFTRESLVKLLRFNKRYFNDGDKFEEVLKAYSAFSLTANSNINASSDQKGNKAASFSKTVNSSLPDEFILTLPIFKGQPNETFRVEICLDSTENTVRFWFESVELNNLIKDRTEEVFAAQIEAHPDFVVINK